MSRINDDDGGNDGGNDGRIGTYTYICSTTGQGQRDHLSSSPEFWCESPWGCVPHPDQGALVAGGG